MNFNEMATNIQHAIDRRFCYRVELSSKQFLIMRVYNAAANSQYAIKHNEQVKRVAELHIAERRPLCLLPFVVPQKSNYNHLEQNNSSSLSVGFVECVGYLAAPGGRTGGGAT